MKTVCRNYYYLLIVKQTHARTHKKIALEHMHEGYNRQKFSPYILLHFFLCPFLSFFTSPSLSQRNNKCSVFNLPVTIYVISKRFMPKYERAHIILKTQSDSII